MSLQKEEEVVITLEDEPPTKGKGQSSLTSFFSGSTSAMKEVKKPDNVNKTVKKQTLQIETAEKWKTTTLVQYDKENWLSIQPDDNNKKLVKTMYYKLCREVENEICRLPQFNYTLLKDGCVRFELLAAGKHATRGPHKTAYHIFFCKKGLGPRERTAKVSEWQEIGQMSLVKSFYSEIIS